MAITFNQSLLRQLLCSGIATLCFTMIALNVLAVSPGRIMSDDEAGQADVESLATEAGVFKSIGMGIALSIAQCEGQDVCTTVNSGELNQLVQALDSRIDGLILRQQENGEDLNDVITAYVNERENYAHYIDTLGKISVGQGIAEEEISTEDTLSEEEVIQEPSEDLSIFEDSEEDLGIFEDSDEDLGDDEEIKDDVDPENP